MSARSATGSADAARAGRRAATLVYWIVAIYAVVAGLASVIPQTFWPDEATSCRSEIEALERDLVARGLGNDAAWQAAWEGRYRAVAPRCGQHPAYLDLGALRDGIFHDAQLAADTRHALGD